MTYTYPDTNMGGNCKSTNPKAEQEAVKEKDRETNGLYIATCKHIVIDKSKDWDVLGKLFIHILRIISSQIDVEDIKNY